MLQARIAHQDATYRSSSSRRREREHTPPADRLRFYRFLYRQPGYVEVVAGTNNPGDLDQIDLLVLTQANFDQCKHDRRYATRNQRFVWFDPADADSITTLDRRVSQLEQAHGNVYVSVCQYREQNRQFPLPTQVVLVEDAPANPALPYSLVVQTSPGSRHGYYQLDQAVNAVQYSSIASRIAAALNADMSGVDMEQLVRVPGTRNTKRKYGTPFAVRLEAVSGGTYTRDALEVAYQPSTGAGAERATWSKNTGYQVPGDVWERASRLDVSRGGALLNERGIPRKLKKQSAQWIVRLIIGDQTLTNKHNEIDTSRMRWNVIKSLGLHGYDDDEIAAIALEVAAWRLGEKRSAEDIETDIIRCISKFRLEYPAIKINRTDQYNAGRRRKTIAESDRPGRASRARKDRPQRADADSVYQFYASHAVSGKHTGTRKADAENIGISTATLDRLDARLKDTGRITITVPGNRRYRVVTVNSQMSLGVINIGAGDTDSSENPADANKSGYGVATPKNDAAGTNSQISLGVINISRIFVNFGVFSADVDNAQSGVVTPENGDKTIRPKYREITPPSTTPPAAPAAPAAASGGCALSPDADLDFASLSATAPQPDAPGWEPQLDELSDILPAPPDADPGPPLQVDEKYYRALGAGPRRTWVATQPTLPDAATEAFLTAIDRVFATPDRVWRDREGTGTIPQQNAEKERSMSYDDADLLLPDPDPAPVPARPAGPGPRLRGGGPESRRLARKFSPNQPGQPEQPQADPGTLEQPQPTMPRGIPLQGAAKRNISVEYHLHRRDRELARVQRE